MGLSGLFLTIPFITMSFYAGTVIDRVDRRRFLLWIEGLNLAVVLIVATLVATGRIEVWHIYISNALHALLGAFESPARSSLIRHLVRPEDLMSAISLHSVLRRGTQIVGPALGGIAVATVDVTGAYFIHAGSYVLLLWSIVLMRTTNPPAERGERNPLRSFAEGIGYVRTEGVIATLLLLEPR